MTIETKSFETIHLRPRSFETTVIWDLFIWDLFIWDLFIWDHVHMRLLHLRPRSFETTLIWHHIDLRPQSFQTTLIWEHIRLRPLHLRPHSFETTFIWDCIHFRLHSFEITFTLCHVKVMLFWFTVVCITFYLPFTSLRETWSFASWLFIWSVARLCPSVCRGDSCLFLNAPALRVGSGGGQWG